MSNKPHALFSVYGIEIEYMIVDQQSLNVLPICDKLLNKLAKKITNEVSLGRIAVSNELALHVIELKTNGPRKSLDKLDTDFHQVIQQITALLDEENACLMPSGMHPWFDPAGGFCLWPHGDKTIYNTYHRIFNCSGHGWSNLQSTHINLPFANDAEFVKLHSAIRFILPLIPALTASTPFMHDKISGLKNTRLEFYGKNQKAIPSIAGEVIPEFVPSKAAYEKEILLPMYEAIHSHDPEKVLQEEWLNSRGAIARFDRNAIEIRIMDTQECPTADIACVELITEVIRWVIENLSQTITQPIETAALKHIYLACIQSGMDTQISEKSYLNLLGYNNPIDAKTLWQDLFNRVDARLSEAYKSPLQSILNTGALSERLLAAYEKTGELKPIYEKLCACLNKNELFHA